MDLGIVHGFSRLAVFVVNPTIKFGGGRCCLSVDDIDQNAHGGIRFAFENIDRHEEVGRPDGGTGRSGWDGTRAAAGRPRIGGGSRTVFFL
jgi:hypothetical protein